MADKPVEEDSLTDKQKIFCKEYIIDSNATRAALSAGYSEKTARNIGCENLSKPYIADYIKELQRERMERVQVSADDVLRDILETRLQAAELEKLGDRLKANELLGKHLAMWTENLRHGSDPDNPISLTVGFVNAKNTDT